MLAQRLVRLSTTIRFDFANNRPDSVAEASLEKLKAYMHRPENLRRELTVIGFSSAGGTDAANLEVSRRRAHSIADRIRAFGNVRVAEDFGVGKNVYVACNDSESRAMKNQRVEIWISPR